MKLIVGVRGTGKTKQLIEMVNKAAEESKGSVICIEYSNKLNFDITYKARLIDATKFHIDDAHKLTGFVAGIAASNHDITDLFIDSALKICNNDMDEFIKFVEKADKMCADHNIELVMTSSIPAEEVPAELKGYIG